MAEKWAQKASKEMERKGTKGALHAQLGVPQGEKIGQSRLAAAAKRAKETGNTKLARRVAFARNVNK